MNKNAKINKKGKAWCGRGIFEMQFCLSYNVNYLDMDNCSTLFENRQLVSNILYEKITHDNMIRFNDMVKDTRKQQCR